MYCGAYIQLPSTKKTTLRGSVIVTILLTRSLLPHTQDTSFVSLSLRVHHLLGATGYF